MRVTFCRPRSTRDASAGIGLAAAVAAGCMAREGASAQTAVDLQLVLAVDVSGSVNAQRFELQKMGYVAAFQNRRVLSAILGGAQPVDRGDHDAVVGPVPAVAGGALDRCSRTRRR